MNSFEVLDTWFELVPKTQSGNVPIKSYGKTLPTTIDEFYLWLVKSRPDAIFLFNEILEGFDLNLSYQDNGILFTLKVNRGSLMAENAGYTHQLNIPYRNNDQDFLNRARKVEFKAFPRDYYGEGEETINVHQELTGIVDTNLASQYIKSDVKYSQKVNHEKAVAVLRSELMKLGDVFAL